MQKVYDNVVIEEVNVDTLKEYTLTLNSRELEKDIDYTVSETGNRYKVLVDVCVIPPGVATVVFLKKRRRIRKL